MNAGFQRRLNWLVWLTLTGTLFTAVVMLVGAWTRLVDAGLGCPDWPGCYGKLLVPDSEHAYLHHPDAPLDPFKASMEMFHRYLATLLGIVVLLVVRLGWSQRRQAAFPWRLSLVLLLAIIVQGAFGAYTVTLKLWPQVVTLHLLGGMCVLALFLWLHLRLRRLRWAHNAPRRKPTRWWGMAAGLLVLQLAMGGWVSSNYAGIACQGMPTCNGEWWPSMDVSEGFHLTQTVGPNYLHGQLHADARTAIHMGHRLGGVLLGVALIMLWWRTRLAPGMTSPMRLVVALFSLQCLIGAANVLMWLPLWLALVHTAGAIALSMGLLWAWWQWRYAYVDVKSERECAEVLKLQVS